MDEAVNSEGRYAVVSPQGRRRSSSSSPHRGSLAPGTKVAFLWDNLFKGDEMAEIFKAALLAVEPGLEFVSHEEFGNIHDNDMLARIAEPIARHGVDLAVVSVGACGSCTPAVVRTCAEVEKLGVKAVAVVGDNFDGTARAMSAALGISHLPLIVYPGPGLILNDSPEEFERKVREVMAPAVVTAFTNGHEASPVPEAAPSEASTDPLGVFFTGTLDEVHEHFIDNYLSDGLPFVPPTRQRIDAFLARTDRSPDEVIGVLLPDNREATVASVAANAVMAGCRPEYFPTLLALAECLADPDYGLREFGCTPGIEPLVIVSGPVVADLGLNARAGMMRVGRRANTSIGRFVRLFMINVAGLRIPSSTAGDEPARFVTDNAAIGQGFYVAMAEDADAVAALGWPAFGADLGFGDASVVTTTSVVGTSLPIYSAGDDPEDHLSTLATYASEASASWGIMPQLSFVKTVPWSPVLLLGSGVAHALALRGITKDDIRRELAARCTISTRRVERDAFEIGGVTYTIAAAVKDGVLPSSYSTSDDPDELVPQIPSADDIHIVVGGHPGRNQSKFYVTHSLFGAPTSRVVPAS